MVSKNLKILKIFCDGGSRGNPGPSAAAFAVYDQKNKLIYQAAKFLGRATNNIAEYEALILAYNWLISRVFETDASQINFFLDSELVVKQLTGVYRVKNKDLLKLYKKIKNFEESYGAHVGYKYVRRVFNKTADGLVNSVLNSQPVS